MNKRILLIILVVIAIAFLVFAAPPSQPEISYPSTTDIRINTGTEINWTNSSDSDGDIIKYNLFYSNDSGTNWHPIAFDWGYENRLNDSSTSKNLSFSGNENQTVYIDIPKVANITSAKLNLSGYQDIAGPYTRLYNSFNNESESDGNRDGSASYLAFGRVGVYDPIDIYLLVYTPPDGNLSKLELRLGPGGASPETRNFVYNVYIAETDDYLIGDPTDDNTTSYTKVKNEINVSAEWGDAQNVYKNITFDDSYSMNSSKKYIMWFEFVSGQEGVNSGYTIIFDDDVTNNYSAASWGTVKTSYKRLFESSLYAGIEQTASSVWLEVGNPDGNREGNFTGNFTSTNTTADFKSALQDYLDINCTNINLWENCSVPITIHSDTAGKIEISGINIQFTDYWWNTSDMKELTTYKINITPSDGTSNGSSSISANDFTISHNSPSITLNSPAVSYSNSSSDPVSVEFNCSAEDDWELSNVSLYITDKNNQSFSLNKTTSVSGMRNYSNWTLGLNNGDYTWACLVYDVAGNYNWSNNRSIKINYVAPAPPQVPGGGGGGTISKILFDVKILKFDSPANISSLFNFTYFVKGTGTINQDIVMKFWLEKGSEILSSGFDTIYFGVNEEYTENAQLSLPSTASEGIYDFYVEAVYGQYSAKANRKIEIISSEKENVISIISCSEFNLLDFIKKIWYYILMGFGFLLIFFLLFLLLRKKKKKLHNLGSIKGTKIVSEEGIYMGDVEDVYLKGNDIHGWLIKPRKTISKKIKDKKFLIKNKDVKKIGEIMIVDKKISDFFK